MHSTMPWILDCYLISYSMPVLFKNKKICIHDKMICTLSWILGFFNFLTIQALNMKLETIVNSISEQTVIQTSLYKQLFYLFLGNIH